jgi:hypothetical protein
MTKLFPNLKPKLTSEPVAERLAAAKPDAASGVGSGGGENPALTILFKMVLLSKTSN